jgi:ASC-1-like (ASCH) protein
MTSWLTALGYALLFVVLVISALLLGRWAGLCGKPEEGAIGPSGTNGGGFYGGGLYGGEGYGGDDGDMMGGGQFRLKVSDPEYTALLDGKKTIEIRPDRPPFARLKEGEVVTIVRARPKDDTSEYPGGKYKHDSTIVRISKHSSLDAALKKEALAKVYPGKSAAEAAERFKMYLPPGAGAGDPVLAIELKLKK